MFGDTLDSKSSDQSSAHGYGTADNLEDMELLPVYLMYGAECKGTHKLMSY